MLAFTYNQTTCDAAGICSGAHHVGNESLPFVDRISQPTSAKYYWYRPTTSTLSTFHTTVSTAASTHGDVLVFRLHKSTAQEGSSNDIVTVTYRGSPTLYGKRSVEYYPFDKGNAHEPCSIVPVAHANVSPCVLSTDTW